MTVLPTQIAPVAIVEHLRTTIVSTANLASIAYQKEGEQNMSKQKKEFIKCENCKIQYTDEEFNKLEVTGHNIIWNFDYRRCRNCGVEITPVFFIK